MYITKCLLIGPPHPGSAWQTSLSDVHSAVASHHPHPAHAHVMPAGSVGPGVAAGVGGAGMIIPRAKVKRSGGGGYTNEGYNSDDGGVSDEVRPPFLAHAPSLKLLSKLILTLEIFIIRDVFANVTAFPHIACRI